MDKTTSSMTFRTPFRVSLSHRDSTFAEGFSRKSLNRVARWWLSRTLASLYKIARGSEVATRNPFVRPARVSQEQRGSGRRRMLEGRSVHRHENHQRRHV